jgi:hypothetical protein
LKIRAQLLRTWSGPLPTMGRLPNGYLLEVVSEQAIMPSPAAATFRRIPRALLEYQP